MKLLTEEHKETVLDAVEAAIRQHYFEGKVSRHPGRLVINSEGQDVLWFHFQHGRLLGTDDLGPDYSKDSTPPRMIDASCDAAREPQKVAREMLRRLIVPHLARWRGEHQARLARRQGIDRAAAFRGELAELLGRGRSAIDPHSDGSFRAFLRQDGACAPDDVYRHEWVMVEASVSSGSYGCSLDFSYLSFDQGRALIECLRRTMALAAATSAPEESS